MNLATLLFLTSYVSTDPNNASASSSSNDPFTILDPFYPLNPNYDPQSVSPSPPLNLPSYQFQEDVGFVILPETINQVPDEYHHCNVDMMFLVDRTGSMSSNQSEVKLLVNYATNYLVSSITGPRVALSAVHENPAYDLLVDFTEYGRLINASVNSIVFEGGGLMQEPYELAFKEAAKEDWRENASRLIIVFADEVPSEPQLPMLQQVVTKRRQATIMVNYGGKENLDVWETNTEARITNSAGLIPTLDKTIDYLCFKYM